MRRVARPSLPNCAVKFLKSRQDTANVALANGTLDINKLWKAARALPAMKGVMSSLQQATGPIARCMYCLDSHGSDIEHFRPKSRFPRFAFRWTNLLLCCTECGRFKGALFPQVGRRPLLINPTAEDPWTHLDFDPATGNLTARFDVVNNEWFVKGKATVDVLQLDRREALAAVYRRSYRRLEMTVQTALAEMELRLLPTAELCRRLIDIDDHGLLRWCLLGSGQTIAPFATLRTCHPAAWRFCVRACTGRAARQR